MLTLPNGSAFALASTYGASKAMSAVTNAAEGVATLEAAHAIIVGDIFEVNSGWGDLDGRLVRAKTVSTNDVTLEGINTASTTRFPAGSGTGTIRECSAWTSITQVLEATTSGGDPKFYTYQYLDAQSERQVPTGSSAQSLSLKLADDQTLPWFAALDAADLAGTPTGLRITLPSGAKLYYNCYVSFNKTPTLSVNNAMALTCSLSLAADPTRYAS
jgi:hypothetical protein